MARLQKISQDLSYDERVCLGEGGFGSVYRGKIKLDGKFIPCAVKILKKNNRDPTQAKKEEYFAKESKIAEQLDHPNIIKTYQTGSYNDSLYIAMEYCPNGSLFSQFYKQKSCFKEEDIKPFAVDILKGLVYIHGKGICHRDLKMENILLDANNNLKLADFGFAKSNNSPFSMIGGMGKSKIMHSIVGTPGFISPEIAVGQFTTKADIFSFGCMIYHMATGNTFFDINFNDRHENVENQIRNFSSEKVDFSKPCFKNSLFVEFIKCCINSNLDKRLKAVELLEHPWLNSINKDNLFLSAINIERLEMEREHKNPAEFHAETAGKTIMAAVESVVSLVLYKYSHALWTLYRKLDDVLLNLRPPISDQGLDEWKSVVGKSRFFLNLMVFTLDKLEMGQNNSSLLYYTNWLKEEEIVELTSLNHEEKLAKEADPYLDENFSEIYNQIQASVDNLISTEDDIASRHYLKYFKDLFSLLASKCGNLKIDVHVSPRILTQVSCFMFSPDQRSKILADVHEKIAGGEFIRGETRIDDSEKMKKLDEYIKVQTTLEPFLN